MTAKLQDLRFDGPQTPGHVVGWRVRQRRKELGLSQHQTAQKMGEWGLDIPDASYSRVEIGKSEMVKDVNTLLALALALDCTVAYLLGISDSPDKGETT